ncbi:DUF7836 family putative zinc-binding protein [Halocatena halophila]|uniref:DUF7836 family putative zinc-binding protein n=1 Tax=Halocatena halophila TaxID=2814576 RepID=UPI002ED287C8
MPPETYVRLQCPSCSKQWTSQPGTLPEANDDFDCPDCGTTRSLAEFARTEHDLETMKQFS